jgi:hypothetical protein
MRITNDFEIDTQGGASIIRTMLFLGKGSDDYENTII